MVGDTDGDGASDAQDLLQNRRPLPAIIAPRVYIAGLSATVSSLGSRDPDGEIASYLWTLQGNRHPGPSAPFAPDALLPITFTSLTLTATDDKGETGTRHVRVIVLQPLYLALVLLLFYRRRHRAGRATTPPRPAGASRRHR